MSRRVGCRRGRPAASPKPTLSLSAQAATFIDAQVAGFVDKVGPAQLDRLVAEAIARFMPERAREDAENAADGRHLKFHHQQVSFNGTTFVEGELDLADALDLDAAITRAAEQLKLTGCQEPLDVRRAMAAGELGRRQLTLDLTDTDADRRVGGKGDHAPDEEAEAAPGGALRAPLRSRHHRERWVTGPGASGEPPPRRHRRPGQGLVCQPRHPDHRQARDRPRRAHPGRCLRGPRPPRRTDPAPRRRLRVPLVHPPGTVLRQRPRHSPRRRWAYVLVQHRAACADDITD